MKLKTVAALAAVFTAGAAVGAYASYRALLAGSGEGKPR